MRASWVFLLASLSACGGGGVKDLKDTPPPAPAGATCHAAGSHLIELVVANQNPAPPDDAVNKLIALVEKRCETDAWSVEARGCFGNIKTVEDADGCTKTLSDAQLKAMSADMAPPGETPPDSPPPTGATPPPPPPPPAPTRGPAGKTGDPCDGGE